jgi:hypothetical protein
MTQPFRTPSPVMDLHLEDALEFNVEAPNAKPQPQPKKRPDKQAAFLMDEIFGEVEQVLDGSLVPPDEPVVMETERADIRKDIAAVLADRYPQLARSLEEPEGGATMNLELPELPAPATELSKPEEKLKATAKPQSSLSLFERFMIFTGCSSAIAALAVWLVAQGMLPKGIAALSQKMQNAAVTATASNTPAASEVDIKFSEYMLRSLAAMDRTAATKPAAAKSVATLPAPMPQASTQPNVAISGQELPQPKPLNLPGASSGAVASAVVPQVSPVAPVTVQPPADMVTRREMNQVMNRIVGMLERIAPGVSSRLPLPGVAPKIATVAKAPATRAAAKVAGVTAAPGAATAAPNVNLPQRTLTGVVEMGDRSAVLFELNGVTQRIYLGETIGSTGWSLVEVAKDSAILRRNGEVRTLGVGQKI